MPEGVYHRALKAVAEIVEEDIEDLLWDLVIYRYVLQRVVDVLWNLDVVLEKSQVHRMFYGMLGIWVRAHVAKNIYSTAIALALIESAKSNGGSKSIVRRLSVGLDYQDAKG